jgi:hypothetical protein
MKENKPPYQCTMLDRFERIEKMQGHMFDLLEAHLIEGGNVRTDLAWLKKGVWVCAAAALSSLGSFAVALVMYILKK